MRCRGIVLATCLVAACLLWSTPARAATVPPGTVVRVDRVIDVTAFARAIAARYDVVLRRVVAADIDRDGDLDVLATTDRDVVVWLNDGTGRLTSDARRSQSSAINRHAPRDTWRDRGTRHDETIQDDLPSPKLPGRVAHAPLLGIGAAARAAAAPAPHDALCGAAAPRAPPTP